MLAAVSCFAVLGCGPADRGAPLGDVGPLEAEPAWAVESTEAFPELRLDPTTGDIAAVAHGGPGERVLRRYDPEGRQRFSHEIDDVWDLAFTADGTMVVLGDCASGPSIGGVSVCEATSSAASYLVELGASGEVKRSLALDPEASGFVSVQRLAVAADGRVHLAGRFGDTVDFGDGELEGEDSLFHLALDADWKLRWSASYGGTGVAVDDLIAEPDGGDVFMVGSFRGIARFGEAVLTSAGQDAVFLLRSAPDGDVAWAKHFVGSGFFDAQYLDDGSIVVSGVSYDGRTSVGSDRGVIGLFVSVLRPDGDHRWTRQLGDAQTQGLVRADRKGRIVVLSAGSVLVEEAGWNDPDCVDDTCRNRPPDYDYRRVLRILGRDGGVRFERVWSHVQDPDIASFHGALAVADGAIAAAVNDVRHGVDPGDGLLTGPNVMARLEIRQP